VAHRCDVDARASVAGLLEREPRLDARAHGLVLLAGVCNLRGEHGAALGLLTMAETQFTAQEMRMHAAYAAYRRGLLEGSAGSERVVAASALMRAEGIVAPEAWLAVQVPGFTLRSRSS
jgi:hypothetical protein